MKWEAVPVKTFTSKRIDLTIVDGKLQPVEPITIKFPPEVGKTTTGLDILERALKPPCPPS